MQNRLIIPGEPDSLYVGALHPSGKKLWFGSVVLELAFAFARVRIDWKTQWIMATESESIVFLQAAVTQSRQQLKYNGF